MKLSRDGNRYILHGPDLERREESRLRSAGYRSLPSGAVSNWTQRLQSVLRTDVTESVEQLLRALDTKRPRERLWDEKDPRLRSEANDHHASGPPRPARAIGLA